MTISKRRGRAKPGPGRINRRGRPPAGAVRHVLHTMLFTFVAAIALIGGFAAVLRLAFFVGPIWGLIAVAAWGAVCMGIIVAWEEWRDVG